MATYLAPRRVISTATTITLQSATTALSKAAEAAPSQAFTQFDGRGLSARSPHPTSGVPCNVTEDGFAAGHTAIGWGAKGCYDPTTKRVMWASTGANVIGTANARAYDTLAIYDEAANNGGGLWSDSRGFYASNSATSTTAAIGHLYDSLCIDVTGRKFYKQTFPSSVNELWVYDLDAGTWLAVTGAPQYSSARLGALEFIPTRGANGAIWCCARNNANTIRRIWEKQLPDGAWTEIVSTGLGSLVTSSEALPMSYNPRSKLVFVGGLSNTAYIINPSSLAITPTTHPAGGSFAAEHRAHLCKDPAGNGWLYFDAYDTGRVYKCLSTGAWTNEAVLPQPDLQVGSLNPFIVVPIDDYGVVWLVRGSNTGGSPAAFLYRP